MKKAVLLLGHGSRIPGANESLYSVADMVKSKSGLAMVKPVFLQFASPTLLEGIEACLAEGAEEILIHPYFLYPGAHVLQDIPSIIERIQQNHPGVSIRLTPPLGIHEKLVEIVLERLKETSMPNGHIPNGHTKANENGDPEGHISFEGHISSHQSYQPDNLCDPALIEKKSLEIISAHIQEDAFPKQLRNIIKRAIHATGDLAIASDIRYSPHFYQMISEALLRGVPIITDVFMVKEGLSPNLLAKFHTSVFCFIRDEEVRETAENEGITRAMAALRKGASLYPEGVYLVGNAPTALWELIHLYRDQKIEPAAIVGCPVGFVGASDSKEELSKTDLPYFTCLGSKGGSPMAAAVINAILKELP